MQYSSLSGRDLIKRSQKNDDEAFEEMISRDTSYIFGWIMQRTRNEFLAEELLQITLIKCWKNIKKFKGGASFRTWACAIARNLFIDHYRKTKRRKEESLEFGTEGHRNLKTMMGPRIDPLKNFKNEELRIFLDEIMDGLSAPHRNALYYSAIEELTYREISKIEKCSAGTIMSRLFYARKKAQDLIKKHKDYKHYGINK